MIITGSTIYNHFSHPCLYRIHQDLFGNKEERVQAGAAGQYLMERGNRHEVQVFAHLQEKYPDDCIEISKDPNLSHADDIERRIAETIVAMKAGPRFIMHGFISSEPGDFQTFAPGVGKKDSKFCFRGETDLLERRDDLASDYGDYAYVVGDVKSSRHAKFGQKMQVAFYSAILARRQGTYPPTGFIITGDTQREEFSTDDLSWSLRLFLEEELAECVEAEEVTYHFGPRCRFCHWRNHCEKKATDSDDLSLVPGCRPAEKRALVAAGIPDRSGLLNQTEKDLRELGRQYGNRLDGFRDLKQKAGAQQFGMAIMRQDPRTSMLGHSKASMTAPCIFRHRGPVLLVDAVPDYFFGDEALLAFSLVRPRDKDEESGSLNFTVADNPGDCVSTLRSLFVELNNTNKLLNPTRERALLVFVDSSLPYRLRRQAAALWQEHGSAPTSVERLLCESSVLSETVERTYHLPIDAYDLESMHRVIARKNEEPLTMRSPLAVDAFGEFCGQRGSGQSEAATSALEKVDRIFADYGIDKRDAMNEKPGELDAIFVREWRQRSDASYQLLLQFNLAERLKLASSILRMMSRLAT